MLTVVRGVAEGHVRHRRRIAAVSAIVAAGIASTMAVAAFVVFVFVVVPAVAVAVAVAVTVTVAIAGPAPQPPAAVAVDTRIGTFTSDRVTDLFAPRWRTSTSHNDVFFV